MRNSGFGASAGASAKVKTRRVQNLTGSSCARKLLVGLIRQQSIVGGLKSHRCNRMRARASSALAAKAQSDSNIDKLALHVKKVADGTNAPPPGRGPSFIVESHQYSIVKTPEACASRNAEIMYRSSTLNPSNDVYSSIDRMIALEAFKKALKRSNLFGSCSDWMSSELFKQSAPLHVDEGDVLQRKGDSGDIMLVTITCNVTREEDGTNHPAGMVIGESALVGDAPHESTFVVSSPGVILAVHRMHYRQIAIQGAKLRHFDDPRHATIIADLPLLAPLNEKQLESALQKQSSCALICPVRVLCSLKTLRWAYLWLSRGK